MLYGLSISQEYRGRLPIAQAQIQEAKQGKAALHERAVFEITCYKLLGASNSLIANFHLYAWPPCTEGSGNTVCPSRAMPDQKIVEHEAA